MCEWSQIIRFCSEIAIPYEAVGCMKQAYLLVFVFAIQLLWAQSPAELQLEFMPIYGGELLKIAEEEMDVAAGNAKTETIEVLR